MWVGSTNGGRYDKADSDWWDRIRVGQAFGYGLGKLPPSEGFVGAISKLGFPFLGTFAWAASFGEFGGGLFLALGLLTRPGRF
ncbi:MAG TPA: hypothetical protein DIU35_13640 [Candidatus Latescibacteria bacterium]|nr:hypothetical protein [Gemmatimonadota bacterium]HCR18515.1 hypothetical protein [Candidatus Latescibacterota bacterium]